MNCVAPIRERDFFTTIRTFLLNSVCCNTVWFINELIKYAQTHANIENSRKIILLIKKHWNLLFSFQLFKIQAMKINYIEFVMWKSNIEKQKNIHDESSRVCLLFHWLFLSAGLFNCLYGESLCERAFFFPSSSLLEQKLMLSLTQCLFTRTHAECVCQCVKKRYTHHSAYYKAKPIHIHTYIHDSPQLGTETTFFYFFLSSLRTSIFITFGS